MDYFDLLQKEQEKQKFDAVYSKEFSVEPQFAEPVKIKKKKTSLPLFCCCFVFLLSLIVIGAALAYFEKDIIRSYIDQTFTTQTTIPVSNDETSKIDLRNLTNEELAKLGVITIPENSVVEDTYKGIQLISTPSRELNDEEIAQIKFYIDNLPSKLTSSGPLAIISVTKSSLGNIGLSNPLIVAFASGPYIFVTDQTFEGNFIQKGVSFDDVEKTMAHEFMHVQQFYSIPDQKLDTALDSNMITIDLAKDSENVIDFAKEVGWQENIDSGGNILSWQLGEDDGSQKTTKYGKTSPAEDLSESISYLIMGEGFQFSKSRISWCEEFLGESEDELVKGRIPIYSDSTRVKVIFGEGYNVNKFQQYQEIFHFADAQNYNVEEENQIDLIADFYREEFESRKWKEKEWKNQTSLEGVETFTGVFTYGKRQVDIEIESYDSAQGFIVKPKGTLISVISGINFE